MTELLVAVQVLGRLVEDLRTLALTESGALKLEKLRVESPLDLPFVTIDAVRIREVLVNLVTNAIEHTPSGGTIVISLTHAGNEGISVEVAAAQLTISTRDLFPPGGPMRQHQDSGLELPIVRK